MFRFVLLLLISTRCSYVSTWNKYTMPSWADEVERAEKEKTTLGIEDYEQFDDYSDTKKAEDVTRAGHMRKAEELINEKYFEKIVSPPKFEHSAKEVHNTQIQHATKLAHHTEAHHASDHERGFAHYTQSHHPPQSEHTRKVEHAEKVQHTPNKVEEATAALDWWEEALTEEEPMTTEINLANITVREAVRVFKIAPDILDSAPRLGIEINYGPNTSIHYGNFISEEDVKEPPTRMFWEADSSKYYTLIFSGPDVPSRKFPVQREWLQWLVGNIRGSTVGTGEVFAEYMSPFAGRDARRFVFMVFEQPTRINYEKRLFPDTSVSYLRPALLRPLFSTKDFFKQHAIGKPKAINFFRIRPNDV